MPTHSSASSQQSQYEIPRELQEVLLDFTVHYLIEQPADLIHFAQAPRVTFESGGLFWKNVWALPIWDSPQNEGPFRADFLGP